MSRVIVINENTARRVWSGALNEAFHPSRHNVLKVKNYLDSTFTRDAIDDVDDEQMPKKVAMADIVSNGQLLRQMDGPELLMHLDDKFEDMIKNPSDRERFLKAVINYWYRNEISKEGMLPVNTLS